MHEMIDIDQYLCPTSNKGEDYRKTACTNRYEKFLEETTQKDIKCGISPLILEDIEYKDMNYHTMDPEEWIGITNRKNDSYKVLNNKSSFNKKAVARKEDSDRNVSLSTVPHSEKKARTGRQNPSSRNCGTKILGIQYYCVLCKNSGMPKVKYALHYSYNLFDLN